MFDHVAAIIPAGGCGTFGDGQPKLLHGLPTGRSIIGEVIHRVGMAGVREIVVTENNYVFRRQIRDHLDVNGGSEGVRFAHQNERSGAAKAVQLGIGMLSRDVRSVLVVYGDMPLWSVDTLRGLIECRAREDADVALVTLPLDERTPEACKRFGRIIRRRGKIVAIYEPDDDIDPDLLELADSISPSLFAFGLGWLIKHLPLIEPVERSDGFDPEYHLPKVLAVDETVRVAELTLSSERFDEARGINDEEEYRKACEIMEQQLVGQSC